MLVEFIKMHDFHMKMVLKWRTKPEVTQFMATDIDDDLEKQKRWFKLESQKNSSKWWIINFKNKPIGVIALVDINLHHKFATWDYYIGEEKYRGRLGAFIPLYFYNYVFDNLKLNKIIATVMDGNINLLKLHELHGYRKIGVYQKHIFKQNKFHDLFILELLKEKWEKEQIKFHKIKADFED